MVMDNICHILCNFIRCSAYENIIFCWVMHEQSIIDDIVSRLDLTDCKLHSISLVCSEDALRERITADVKSGIRKSDVIERSVERIPLYYSLDTAKVDVSNITSEEAAERISKLK